MKLVITHVNKAYDRNEMLRPGLELLVDAFGQDNIIELSDRTKNEKNINNEYGRELGKKLTPVWSKQKKEYIKNNLERGYISHCGKLIYSTAGGIDYTSKEVIDEIKNEDNFILTGGYFGACHKATFSDILKINKNKLVKFVFPGDAINLGIYLLKDLAGENCNEIPKRLTQRYFLDKSFDKESLLLVNNSKFYLFRNGTFTPTDSPNLKKGVIIYYFDTSKKAAEFIKDCWI